MRITALRINNVLGIRSLERAFRQPVVLFAGRNGAGKSSLQSAIRMALLGEPERVHLKKDYAQLVAEGAKEGEVTVTVDKIAVHLPLPDGKPTPFTERPQHLAFCLDPARFSRLSNDERRTFLFELVGLKADGQAVMKRLLDKGCEPKYVEAIGEALKSGFPAAHKDATDRAREAKGAWRGVTGETWGKDKADAWAPRGASFGAVDADILARVQKDLATALEVERTAGNAAAALEAKAEAPTIQADPEKAAKVPTITVQLEKATAERDEYQKKVAELQAVIDAPSGLACPHCGGLVVQDGFQLKAFDGHDTAARAQAKQALPQHQESLRVLRVRCQSLTRDLDDAKGHAAKLDAAKAVKDRAPSPHEIEASKEAYQLAQDRSRSLREEETKLLIDQRDAAGLVTKKATADKHHREAMQWLAVAEALSPSGIPAELLASALKPFNDRLRESAVMTGWRQILVDPEMQITAEGRGYHLLSESERWRADAMLAYAIACAGPRFLLLDRLDVLDIPARGEALAWLAALVEQRKLDGAIVCATLKTVPASPAPGVEGYWLEAGQVLELKEAA